MGSKTLVKFNDTFSMPYSTKKNHAAWVVTRVASHQHANHHITYIIQYYTRDQVSLTHKLAVKTHEIKRKAGDKEYQLINWKACGVRLKCDGTRAGTRFRLSPKRMSPFKSTGASVQSTAGSRRVRISVSNAGYTTFRGSVRVLATHSVLQFTLHFPIRASPCAIRFQKHSRSWNAQLLSNRYTGLRTRKHTWLGYTTILK